jgi:hypothetical protein
MQHLRICETQISSGTKTTLHIQQQRMMARDCRLKTRRKKGFFKTSQTHPHFLIELTSHLLEDNIPNNNP